MQAQLNTRITVETFKALDAYCEQTGRSKAEVVNTAIREYLAQQRENKK